MNALRLLILLAACLAQVLVNAADGLDYGLQPRRIAEGTYVFVGRTEDFTWKNGGNIVNTGFIVTRDGVVVIDSGPSRLYGEQMRRAIASVTSKPISRILNTHHHPDHFFGNQAFSDIKLFATPETISSMKQEGGAFADNLYRMSGNWMKGTEPVPARFPAEDGELSVGGHDIRLIKLKGHTQSDLIVLDRTTGVIFTGDLVFHNRAPTTPHASVATWLEALDSIEAIPFSTMVPGHGEVVEDIRAVVQTRNYLRWLDTTMRRAAVEGLDMPELLSLPIPPEFAGMALVRSEYERSIAHLYREHERRVFSGAPVH